MDIVWLCLISLVFMFAGLIYLSLDLYTAGEGIATGTKKLFREHKLLWIYALVSAILLCGMVFWLHFIYPSNGFLMNLKLITLLSVLFIVNVTDIKEHVIPNKVILAALLLRTVYYIAELITQGSNFWNILKNDLFALIIVVFFFIVGVLIMKNGIGMGDIKLMLVMCLFQGLTGVIASLFFSLIIAFIISIVMLIMKKKTRKDSLAFAPSVLLGTMISVFLSGM